MWGGCEKPCPLAVFLLGEWKKDRPVGIWFLSALPCVLTQQIHIFAGTQCAVCLCLLVPSGVRRVARKPDCGVSNMNFIKKYVMKNRLVSIIMLWILATCACLAGKKARVVVAYVTSWTDIMPDPWAMTHINYAFGKVNETFDGVNISNRGR